MWFDVDKAGLRNLLAGRSKAFVLFELLQNAWDENTSKVSLSLERVAGTRRVRVSVEDDNPTGFADLSHAFTLFANSAKKADPDKRGRFNLGEKLVLALCNTATITSTTGSVKFDEKGRHRGRTKREAGSCFEGELPMTDAELAECENAVHRVLPPANVVTTFNGRDLAHIAPLVEIPATLATEVADAEGVLRRTARKTMVRVYEPRNGETPMLYEMGIPVIETGDRWHVDVQQKVPLNFERNSVPDAYLAKIRALVLEAMADKVHERDANEAWVREAMQKHGDTLSASTINRVLDLRFGEKRVAYDPSDVEANARAVASGHIVVHGGNLSKSEWEAARRVGAILPAGQVTPSPKPGGNGGGSLRLVEREKWSPAMVAVASYAARIGQRLLGASVRVRIANDVSWPFAATYGPGELTLNLGRLGHRWFAAELTEINALLIHEFGHHYSGNHLSADYYDALCSLGAKLVALALDEPAVFQLGIGAHNHQPT